MLRVVLLVCLAASTAFAETTDPLELLKSLERKNGTDQETLAKRQSQTPAQRLADQKKQRPGETYEEWKARRRAESDAAIRALRSKDDARRADSKQNATTTKNQRMVDGLSPEAAERLNAAGLTVSPESRAAADQPADLNLSPEQRARVAKMLWERSGPYDQTFTPEELLKAYEDIRKLPDDERKAALKNRADLNAMWKAGRQASALDRQRQQQAQWAQQQAAAQEAYWAREQYINDQIEINVRSMDYLTRPYYDEGGTLHLRGRLQERLTRPAFYRNGN